MGWEPAIIAAFFSWSFRAFCKEMGETQEQCKLWYRGQGFNPVRKGPLPHIWFSCEDFRLLKSDLGILAPGHGAALGPGFPPPGTWGSSCSKRRLHSATTRHHGQIWLQSGVFLARGISTWLVQKPVASIWTGVSP